MSKSVLIATIKPFAKDAKEAAVKIMEQAGLIVNVLEKYEDNKQLLDTFLRQFYIKTAVVMLTA